MAQAPIEIADERDLGFMRPAQGAIVNVITLPSGFRTLARDLVTV